MGNDMLVKAQRVKARAADFGTMKGFVLAGKIPEMAQTFQEAAECLEALIVDYVKMKQEVEQCLLNKQ